MEEEFKGPNTITSNPIDQIITKLTTLEQMKEQLENGLDAKQIMKKSCLINRVDFVKYLIENNHFQINDVCDNHNSYSILHYACFCYCPDIVTYAIEKGIDMRKKDSRDCITAHTDLVYRILKRLLHKSSNMLEVQALLKEKSNQYQIKHGST